MTGLRTPIGTYNGYLIDVCTHIDDSGFAVYAWEMRSDSERETIVASRHGGSVLFYWEGRQQRRIRNAIKCVKDKVDRLHSDIATANRIVSQATGEDVVTKPR